MIFFTTAHECGVGGEAVDGGRSSNHSLRVEHLRMTVLQDRTEIERKREREREAQKTLSIQ